jgi:hypothetical protein
MKDEKPSKVGKPSKRAKVEKPDIARKNPAPTAPLLVKTCPVCHSPSHFQYEPHCSHRCRRLYRGTGIIALSPFHGVPSRCNAAIIRQQESGLN